MPLKVACIGAGFFSQFHYDAWRRIPEVEVIAAVDPNIEAARETGFASYADINAMFSRAKPDVLDIITPPNTHLSLVEQAVKKGMRAIICQKPFCENLAQAKQAVELGRRHDIPIIIHENFRFQPWYRVIKQAIDTKRIGETLQITFRLRPGDGQGPKAYLDRQPYFQRMPKFLVHETAIHFLDVFRFLLGEPQHVYADLRRMNQAICGEDAGYILLSFASGARALFDGNRLLDHAAENTRCTMGEALVEGTQGSIKLLGDGSLRFRSFGRNQEENILEGYLGTNFGGDCVYHFQRHVVDALCNDKPLENLAEAYLENLRLEQLVYQSSERGTRLRT